MTNNILTAVSLTDLRRAVTIRENILQLEEELKLLGEPKPSLADAVFPGRNLRGPYRKLRRLPPVTLAPKKPNYNQTPEGRAEISRRMKASWKRRHAAAARARA